MQQLRIIVRSLANLLYGVMAAVQASLLSLASDGAIGILILVIIILLVTQGFLLLSRSNRRNNTWKKPVYWLPAALAVLLVVFRWQQWPLDLFHPVVVRFVMAALFAWAVYLIGAEIRFWLQYRKPEAKMVWGDPFTIGIIMVLTALGSFMAITSTAGVLVNYPVGGVDPTPILADLLQHGLHDGSAAQPGKYGAVTLGRAKILAATIFIAQMISSITIETDWVSMLVFPKAKLRYDVQGNAVTNIPALDSILAWWWPIFTVILTVIDVWMSAFGAHWVAVNAGENSSFLRWFVLFFLVWLVGWFILFVGVNRQLALHASRDPSEV